MAPRKCPIDLFGPVANRTTPKKLCARRGEKAAVSTLRTFQEGDVSRLSVDAGPINGTYCRRYRDAAVATRASFNENPWELMRNNNR